MFEWAVIIIAVVLLPAAIAVAIGVLPWLLIGALIVAGVVLLVWAPAVGLALGAVVLAAILIGRWFDTAGSRWSWSWEKRQARAEERQQMEQGHSHKCDKGHWWQHTGLTAVNCAIPSYSWEDEDKGRYIRSEDCAVCTEREELLIRGPHAHFCPTCRGEWSHEGRCVSDPLSCPWCSTPREGMSLTNAQRGPHQHYCPQCFQKWEHVTSYSGREFDFGWIRSAPHRIRDKEPCTAPHRIVLPQCPGCRHLVAVQRGGVARRLGRVFQGVLSRSKRGPR